jgi:hypothetical protein
MKTSSYNKIQKRYEKLKETISKELKVITHSSFTWEMGTNKLKIEIETINKDKK